MKKYQVPFNIEITQQQLDDIIDSAVNYCSHWCDYADIDKKPKIKTDYMSEVVTRGGTLKFVIDESWIAGGKTEFVLTEKKMLKALAEYADPNFDDFDGPISDCVLQIALFGEVIYG